MLGNIIGVQDCDKFEDCEICDCIYCSFCLDWFDWEFVRGFVVMRGYLELQCGCYGQDVEYLRGGFIYGVIDIVNYGEGFVEWFDCLFGGDKLGDVLLDKQVFEGYDEGGNVEIVDYLFLEGINQDIDKYVGYDGQQLD